MRDRIALSCARVFDQGAGRAGCRRQCGKAEGGEVVGVELAA